MARFSNIEISDNAKCYTGLTKIYGIGRPTSKKILDTLNIPLNKKIGALSNDEIRKIQENLNQYETEGAVSSKVKLNIKILKEISSYKGMMHSRSLPVRGQRTRRNSRTRKGPRKTVANKKKAIE